MARTRGRCLPPEDFAMDEAQRPPSDSECRTKYQGDGHKPPRNRGNESNFRHDGKRGVVLQEPDRQLEVRVAQVISGAPLNSSRSRRQRSFCEDDEKRKQAPPKEKPFSAAGDMDMFLRQPRSGRNSSASRTPSRSPQRMPPTVELGNALKKRVSGANHRKHFDQPPKCKTSKDQSDFHKFKTSPDRRPSSEPPSSSAPTKHSETRRKSKTIGVMRRRSPSQDRPATARRTEPGRQRQHRKKALTAKGRREREKKKRKLFFSQLTELQLAAASSLGKTKKWRTNNKISDSSGAAPSVGPVAGHIDRAAKNLGNSGYSSDERESNSKKDDETVSSSPVHARRPSD